MRARIELTPEMVADVLREYATTHGFEYVDHEIMPDNGIHIVAAFEMKKAARAPAQPAPQQLPETGVAPATPARKKRADQERPVDPIRDGIVQLGEDEEFVPKPREHTKEIDDEFAAIMAENLRLIEEEKAKRN